MLLKFYFFINNWFFINIRSFWNFRWIWTLNSRNSPFTVSVLRKKTLHSIIEKLKSKKGNLLRDFFYHVILLMPFPARANLGILYFILRYQKKREVRNYIERYYFDELYQGRGKFDFSNHHKMLWKKKSKKTKKRSISKCAFWYQKAYYVKLMVEFERKRLNR